MEALGSGYGQIQELPAYPSPGSGHLHHRVAGQDQQEPVRQRELQLMSDEVVSFLYTLVWLLVCVAFVAIGSYVGLNAKGRVLRIAGFVLAGAFTVFAVGALLTQGTSEYGTDNNPVQCWNFPDRESAQVYYDIVKEKAAEIQRQLRPRPRWHSL